MILCDSNVLIALVDSRDPLQKSARRDLLKMSRMSFFVTEPVLSETVFLLPAETHRFRLKEQLAELNVEIAPRLDPVGMLGEIFGWLAKYAQHAPDWADAHLAVLSQHFPKYRIWTYDQEFHSIWRRPDGSRIPLAIKSDNGITR